MDVIGHHDCGVKLDALSMIAKAMLEDDPACCHRERLTAEFAKSYEYCPAWFLVVRKFAAVFVGPVESNTFGHGASRLVLFYSIGSYSLCL